MGQKWRLFAIPWPTLPSGTRAQRSNFEQRLRQALPQHVYEEERYARRLSHTPLTLPFRDPNQNSITFSTFCHNISTGAKQIKKGQRQMLVGTLGYIFVKRTFTATLHILLLNSMKFGEKASQNAFPHVDRAQVS